MAVRDNDVFATKIRGQYIYQQYQSVEWLKKYAKLIDEYIQTNYFNALETMWANIDIKDSMHEYLTFYTKWYFGLYRPLEGTSLSERYDLGLFYDSEKIYDDAQDANGLIKGELYLKYLKFCLDYTYETWHIDHIVAFVANYCEIDPTQIEVSYEYLNEIRIRIPSTENSQAFIKMVLVNYDAMCLPYPNVLNFMVYSDTYNAWRGIVYSPYSPINQFPRFDSEVKITKIDGNMCIYEIADIFTNTQENFSYNATYNANNKFTCKATQNYRIGD